jgi:hypothetical protein
LLRDTDVRVFSDAALVRLWNEVQQEFAAETQLLERVSNLAVPAIALFTYTQPWEADFGGKPGAILYNYMSPYSYTQPWEIGLITGTDADIDGGYTVSQMWEAIYVISQNRIFHYFPDDCLDVTYIAYDMHPVEWIFRSDIDASNTAFKTRSSTRPLLYAEDSKGGLFYAYPRLTEVYGITDMSGDFGEVVYDDASNDSINPDTDYGVIVFGSSVDIDSDYGIVIRAQVDDDAIQMIYSYSPIPVESTTQTIEWPRWCVKYIEFGVLSRLFKAETDLFNQPLADFFASRYRYGIKLVETLKSNKYAMRTYQLQDISKGKGNQKRRLATLPSNYPSWR